MIALIQRVTEASVVIAGERVADIGPGAMVLVGVRAADAEANAQKLCQRLLSYRMFADENGKMNLDIQQSGGELLLVPQFTLAADTKSGRRPGFSTAAPPTEASSLFDYFCSLAVAAGRDVQRGRFGADMAVSITNDGPVTFWLEA
ncbi:MAG: D-aminoacyl-tRNA deacylase [Granulosicoccaceae bacterium]